MIDGPDTAPAYAQYRPMPNTCAAGIGLCLVIHSCCWSVGIRRRNTGGSGRGGDASENAVRLIGKTGSVKQRGQGLIRVTIAKCERPEAWDRQRPTIVDREGAHGGCQRGAVGREDIDFSIAKIADQQITFK